MKKFCKYQVKCKEDTKSTFTCTAHLHEERCYQCPYKSLNDAKEMSMNSYGHIIKYSCSDAEKVN
jgi:hypothetical protein